ncbi:MAG TPA: S41 family peptidase [bacterium]|nr:S41 family peptidase [bacterium]
MRWFIGIFIAVAVAFIAACEEESAVWGGDSYYGKGNGYDWTANAAGIPEKKPSLDACSVEEVNLWILDTMWDMYLWYDHLATDIDFRGFAEPGDFLNTLKYPDADHFSYISKKEDHDNYYSGKYYGFGFSFRKLPDYVVYVTMVYPGSPADEGGMRRGQRIVAIDGKTVQEIEDQNLWGSVTSRPEDEKEIPIEYVVEENGEQKTLTLYADDVTTPSILKTATLDAGEKKVGYLMLKSFINSTNGELDAAFTKFKADGVTELVVDLRYNGGGLLNGSEHLASLITGGELKDKLFTRLTYNDKHQDYNSDYNFKDHSQSLGLQKVVFIATGGTASASEVVINGLKSYIEVAIIGDTTYGKPVGMNPMEHCDYTLVPITFKLANSEGYGDYYDGLPADCAAADDVTHDFGDPLEESLAAALAYLNDKSCPAAPVMQSWRPGELDIRTVPYRMGWVF